MKRYLLLPLLLLACGCPQAPPPKTLSTNIHEQPAIDGASDYLAGEQEALIPTRNTLAWSEWHFEAYDATGNQKWTEDVHNTVVNTGLDDFLTQYLKGSSYTAAFYIGLTSGTPTVAATDTMSSHAGWTEVTAYSESVRQTAVWGSVSSQSVSTSAASYSINGTTTVGGGFLTTNSTKGGTTGTLISASAFTGGNKSLASGDTLNVTITFSAASGWMLPEFDVYESPPLLARVKRPVQPAQRSRPVILVG